MQSISQVKFLWWLKLSWSRFSRSFTVPPYSSFYIPVISKIAVDCRSSLNNIKFKIVPVLDSDRHFLRVHRFMKVSRFSLKSGKRRLEWNLFDLGIFLFQILVSFYRKSNAGFVSQLCLFARIPSAWPSQFHKRTFRILFRLLRKQWLRVFNNSYQIAAQIWSRESDLTLLV
jgi:hypothetical protein